MRASGYRIADEPRPSTLAHLTVNPFWPFLAVMFGGLWLSWPWFVLNGFAMGSPTRRRELGIAVAGLATVGLALLFVLYLLGREALPRAAFPYVRLSLTLVKLGFTYWLHLTQARTFEIYEFYGGIVRQGFPVILGAYFLNGAVAPKVLEASPWLYLWLA